jgi:signal transduction histidine kinase
MAARVDQESGITCVVDADPALAARLGAQSGDIEQIVRESLSNVARHAQATTCRVGLREDGEFVSLIIDDDGAGFDPAAVDRAGWGLRNLHERATALGGTFELTSQPGEGTTVTIRFPVPEDVP